MATVFTAIPLPKSGGRLFRRPSFLKTRRSSTTEIKILSPVDDLHHDGTDAAEPDIRSLNNALMTLVQVFPDVQPEVFREMLANLSEESRVEVLTEHLLQDKSKWVKGRYVVQGGDKEQSEAQKYQAYTDRPTVSVEDCFRSNSYRQAVKLAFYQEFRGLSHSAIKAVLAEQNHSYTNARPVLQGLSFKSWRYYVTNLWTRKRNLPTDVEQHPLIEWLTGSEPNNCLMPHLKPTSSQELNDELNALLVSPILAQKRETLLAHDLSLIHI